MAALDTSSTYISTQYGAANRQLAGDSFCLTFLDPAVAHELLHGKIKVDLPIRGSKPTEPARGSPVWQKSPGPLQLCRDDFAAAKLLVVSKAIKDLDAVQLSLLLNNAAYELHYSAQAAGSQLQQQQIMQQQKLASSLQHYPGHIKKKPQSPQAVVMFGSPVAAQVLLSRGTLAISQGVLQFIPPTPPLKVRGLQVVLGPHYVGNLLASFRGVTPYKLGGLRVPTDKELLQIKEVVGEVLAAAEGEGQAYGQLPEEPPPQRIVHQPGEKGQVASVLLTVPCQAAAERLVGGVSTTDGLYMRWEHRKMKPR